MPGRALNVGVLAVGVVGIAGFSVGTGPDVGVGVGVCICAWVGVAVGPSVGVSVGKGVADGVGLASVVGVAVPVAAADAASSLGAVPQAVTPLTSGSLDMCVAILG